MDPIVELRKKREKDRQFSKNGNVNKEMLNKVELNTPGPSGSVVEADCSQNTPDNQTALKSILTCDQEVPEIQSPEKAAASKAALKRIARDLRGYNLKRQLKAVQSLLKMVITRDQFILDTVAKTGIVASCVEFLKNEQNVQLQHAATTVLSYFAAEGARQADIVVEAGAVGPLTDMLKSPHLHNVGAAVLALGGIEMFSSRCETEDAHIRIVSSLVALVATVKDVKLLRSVAFSLAKFCTAYGQIWPPQMSKQCIPALIKLTKMSDKQTISYACLALKYLSQASPEVVDELAEQAIKSGIVPKLVQLVDSGDSPVSALCLITICNIGNSELRIQHLIDSGVLPCLVKLLKSTDSTAVRFPVLIAQNIADQGISQRLALVCADDIVPLLVDVLNTGVLDTKKDVVHVIKCIASETEDHITHPHDANAIPALCDMLKIKDVDAILGTLDAISTILKTATMFDHIEKVALAFDEWGGLELIEKLQNHENEEVYKMAFDIIDKYFSE